MLRGDVAFGQSYICSQAPLPSTFADFWRMIWEKECPVIVMLTNLIERNRVKAHTYWPTQIGERIKYGKIVIRLKRQTMRGDALCVRIFDIWKANTSESEDEASSSLSSSASLSSDFTEEFDESWDSATEDSWESKAEEEELDAVFNEGEKPGEVREIAQLHCM